MIIDIDQLDTTATTHESLVCFQQDTQAGTGHIGQFCHIQDTGAFHLVQELLRFNGLRRVQPAFDCDNTVFSDFNCKHRLLPVDNKSNLALPVPVFIVNGIDHFQNQV